MEKYEEHEIFEKLERLKELIKRIDNHEATREELHEALHLITGLIVMDIERETAKPIDDICRLRAYRLTSFLALYHSLLARYILQNSNFKDFLQTPNSSEGYGS